MELNEMRYGDNHVLTLEKGADKDTDFLMDTAVRLAKDSTCKHRQVGAVLSKGGRILITGRNGTILNMDNDCEEECTRCNGTGFFTELQESCDSCRGRGVKTSDAALHAEENVITYAASEGISMEGTTLTLVPSPCVRCAKILIASKIDTIVFKEVYKDDAGLRLLLKAGITVFKYREILSEYKPHLSTRGIPLAYRYTKHDKPVIAVELAAKWYKLFVVNINNVVIELKGFDDWIDHCPRPKELIAFAKKHNMYIDEQSLELMVGRMLVEKEVEAGGLCVEDHEYIISYTGA